MTTPARAALGDLLDFLGGSPTPYHAVDSALKRLRAAGFTELVEGERWSDLPAGRHFVVHGDSSLIAFVVPPSRTVDAFRIVGAHTDSPNLRLKPKPEYTKEGYAQLGVEVYGGALLNSWLDRDLSLAGRALVRAPGSDGARIATRLVRIDRPIARVPQLAIHLDRDIGDKGLTLNRQEHMPPVIGLASEPGADLGTLVSTELGVDPSSIVALDLMFYDVVPPAIGGRSGELLFSARLDNQAMCHAAVTALIASADAASAGTAVPIAALFDHEEVGSQSSAGAGSALLPRVLERIALGVGGSRDDLLRAFARSICISADMAHAVHPNYVERHEARHRPQINGGPVLKVNAQQRYATSAKTGAIFHELCREADVPVQHYAHRTDLPCGSTIGPITSTLLGIPTVDVGNPMLSMHSIREMGGTKDPEMMTRVLARFYASPRPRS